MPNGTRNGLGDDGSERWVGVREAAAEAGVSVGTVRRWYSTGDVTSRVEEGPYGEQRIVPLGEVLARASRTAGRGVEARRTVELSDAFTRLDNVYGQLVDAGERAARAEVRAELVERQLVEARGEVERLRAELVDAKQRAARAEGTVAAAERRGWWRR